ncbi:MAG: hypothetical protein EPN97_03835 [Alphaproteobacteria bacterium]|nr:MAG: hypothetical protein EPN97_03835 [Alphaproteobacteria bacterium]
MNNQKKAVQALETLRSDVAATAENCQRQMQKIDEALAALRQPDDSSLLRVGNGNKKQRNKPLVDARIADTAVYAHKGADLEFTKQDLVRHNDLLAGFANPALRKRNLQAVWEKNLRPLISSVDSSSPTLDHDTALLISENASDTGLAITTLIVANGPKDKLDVVPVHILRNNTTDKTLIVGDRISSKLKKAFDKASITYVDRTADGAQARIEAALTGITANQENKYIVDRLCDAFRYRNDTEMTQGLENAPLSKAMAHPNPEPLYAKYVVKGL